MLKAWLRGAILLLVGTPAALGHAKEPAAPELVVEPADGLFDAPFNIALNGVAPGSEVELRASRQAENGQSWSSVGIFKADVKGRVVAARDASLGGTYHGVSAHGLICSTLPFPPDQLAEFIASLPANPRQPTVFPSKLERRPINVAALVAGKEIARTVSRSFAQNTEAQTISEAPGWKGIYFPAARGVAQGQPVLVLTGSGGGVAMQTAALLASHGHPALAMAMYNWPGLPSNLIEYPIENVRDAALWLAARAGTKRVVVMGMSRGSEAAALAAINFPGAFSALIGVVPSHLTDAGALGPQAKDGQAAWSINGKPTAVVDLGYRRDDPRIFAQAVKPPGYNGAAMVRRLWDDPATEIKYGIPFERLTVPMLVLAAGDDGVWPSDISAAHIRRRFAEHRMPQNVEIHVYPNAGHSMVTIGFGTALSTSAYQPLVKGFVNFGGTPNGNCEASFAAKHDIEKFLSRLGRPPLGNVQR